jgi:hypothetical protein
MERMKTANMLHVSASLSESSAIRLRHPVAGIPQLDCGIPQLDCGIPQSGLQPPAAPIS